MGNSRGGADVIILLILLAVAVWVISIVIMVMMYMALAFAALAVFIAFTWTFVCLLAWRNGFRIGRIILDPEDARAFVVRGLFGAASVPAFLLLTDFQTDLAVPWEYLIYYIAGGYTLFSVGIEYMIARYAGGQYVERHAGITHRPSGHQELLPPPSQPRLPRYASWDDEEERDG